tara:strand:- start:611 stop:808 length:198 start_codon:yes stop_codon:yes gene_type:complete
MGIGTSGRIVIEMQPDLKQELYGALARENKSLKKWFLEHVEEYLAADKTQLKLELAPLREKEAMR